MTITIDLEERLKRDIEAFCAANNLAVEDYVLQLIKDGHATSKFGDLNEIMAKNVEESTVTAKRKTSKNNKTEQIDRHEAEEIKKPKEKAQHEPADPDEHEEEAKETERDRKPTPRKKRELKTL